MNIQKSKLTVVQQEEMHPRIDDAKSRMPAKRHAMPIPQMAALALWSSSQFTNVKDDFNNKKYQPNIR